MSIYKSNGKILLSSEYAVLYGAKAIGLPTKMGQSLIIENRNDKHIEWISYNIDKKIWFNCLFKDDSLIIEKTNNQKIARKLIRILKEVKKLNSNFLISNKTIKTYLDFDYKWGLGTSSTLINNISEWAKINPYTLLKNTFGGSGYDIACASSKSPILFSVNKNKYLVESIEFNPKFKENLFFIYQNKSQNSQKSILEFKKKSLLKKETIDHLSNLTYRLLVAENLKEFSQLINTHEKIIGKLLKINPLKMKFPDYPGTVKSLGAWGGDFFLAVGPRSSLKYFNDKGFKIGFTFDEFILN